MLKGGNHFYLAFRKKIDALKQALTSAEGGNDLPGADACACIIQSVGTNIFTTPLIESLVVVIPYVGIGWSIFALTKKTQRLKTYLLSYIDNNIYQQKIETVSWTRPEKWFHVRFQYENEPFHKLNRHMDSPYEFPPDSWGGILTSF